MRSLFKFNRCENLDDYSPRREGTYLGDALAVELESGEGLFYSPDTGAMFFSTYAEARHRLVEHGKENS